MPELGGIVPKGVGAVGGSEDVAVVDDGAAAEGFALVPVRAQGLNQADLLQKRKSFIARSILCAFNCIDCHPEI